jgi:Undecaprenyl-phosphate glucose phosphotransferase
MTLISRGVVRYVLRKMRKEGLNLRYALIVGAGELAQKVSERLTAHPEFGIELIGCLSSRAPSSSSLGRSPIRIGQTLAKAAHEYAPSYTLKPELQIVGSYQDLPELLNRGGVDQVIIALPLSDHDLLEQVVSSIGDQIVDVKLVPDYHRFIKLGALVEELDGLPVMSLASTPLVGINRVLKRAFDVVVGTTFLILALPVLIAAALLVRLTSRGPVVYSQERVGLDGQTFRIYKFRTMKVDAELHGARFATEEDPRVTSVGKWLRRFSIDELPQLINVVTGHMSLVGPRPERPVFISEFRKQIPDYMLRHKVQAGMTGWAQVKGWRGNTSIERRIEHDLFYIENWSLLFDLKIIVMTLSSIWFDENAY